MTRNELFNMMATRSIVMWKGTQNIVQSIAMEDGSGFCYNVQLFNINTKSVVMAFVRCRKEFSHIPS